MFRSLTFLKSVRDLKFIIDIVNCDRKILASVYKIMSKKLIPRKLGFTLVEILVVLAILVLIAVIFVTVFARVRENGHSAACQSQLKQIALAFQQYVQDSNGLYPQPYTSQDNGENVYWPTYLDPYTKNTKIFFCPNLVKSGNVVFQQMKTTYAYNGLVLEQISTSPPKVRLKSNFHESIIKNPSEVFLNLDQTGDENLEEKVPVSSAGCTDFIDPNASDFYVPALHSGGANYSFYDGHAKWLSPTVAAKIGCKQRVSMTN